MKARVKNRIRNIRSTLNRFGSILLIVALGSGFLAGLLSTSPDMYETADRYYDQYRWYDLDLRGLLGLTAEDAAEAASWPEAEAVQAARVYDMVLQTPDETLYTTRVFAFGDGSGQTGLNRYELLEGRYPEKRNECVAQITGGRYDSDSIRPGSVLVYCGEETQDTAVTEALTESELTVVGICRSPMCVSVEPDLSSVGSGTVGLLLYAPEALFTGESWTDLFITLKGAKDLNTFGDAYAELRDAAVTAITPRAEERARLRAATVRQEAEDTLREANALIAWLQKANDREKALQTEAEQSQETGKRACALLSAWAGEETAALFALPEGPTGPTRPQGIPLLKSLRRQVAEGQKILASVPDRNWLIRTRNDSVGFISYTDNVEKVSALSRVFPVFFFLVALLVALTTMTRLIEENRGQIGTLKSIGYSDRSIWNEYLFYALSASVLGCVLGFVAGFRIFPAVIANAYSMMYMLPVTQTPFRPEIALAVAPVTVGGILLAAFWACRSELSAQPAALLIPRSPKAGKRILLERIGPLWRHLSFTGKVTCRNLFRYKKRFVMTVIGVAGCSALLLTGFGLRDSIRDIVGRQFGSIYHYELTLVMDDASAPTEDPVLRSFLKDGRFNSGWLACSSESGKVRFGSRTGNVSIFVPERTEDLSDYISLRERVSRKTLTLADGAVILTEKLCEQLGIHTGDFITLENAGGRQISLPVAGITENYLTSFAYLTAATWEKAFGSPPELRSLMCLPGTETENATTEAMKSKHVVLARDTAGLKASFADSVRSIDAIVVVLILSAGLLSIVVLYNLINVNICERRRELATIGVLGFFPRETEQYIFRETSLLSLIGSLLGLGVGVWLHHFVVRTVEVEAVMFGRSVHPLSFLYALAISAVFTLLVNQLMKRQIHKVDMVEALKTME